MEPAEPQQTRAERLVIGLLAGAIAIAAVFLVSRMVRSIPFPPVSLAERIIRVTPGDIATFFIERLQHNAIRLLAAGVVVVFLAVAALLPGLVAKRSKAMRAWVPGFALGILTLAAALSGPQPKPPVLGILASAAVTAATYGLALTWMLAATTRVLHSTPNPDRRKVLLDGVSTALSMTVGGILLGRLIRTGRSDVAVRAPDRAAPAPERPPFPQVPGLSSEVTSATDHYVVDINLTKPVVAADSWTLRVKGLVSHPLEIGFSELQDRYEIVEEYSVLTCVSNEVGGPLIGNSRWAGVRLGDLLRDADVAPDAVDLLFHCADGYSVSVPVARAADPHALLAIEQNGAPLRTEHGFPCRVRIPGLYGMMNAKWLEEIEVVGSHAKGFWAQRGWSDIGLVRTGSRIDTVAPAARRGRPSWIAGIAWAGERGISRVEVSSDAGATWEPALVHEPLSSVAWTQWAFQWTPDRRGLAAIMCRAVDGKGVVQDRRYRRPHPSGASGYHTQEVSVG